MPPRRNTPKTPVPFGMSNKQMKRKKPINSDIMRTIEPLTKNQEILFESYNKNQNLVAYDSKGKGKYLLKIK